MKKGFQVGMRQHHALGQVFLRNQKVIDSIVAIVEQAQNKRILEVGPGEGVLTVKFNSDTQITAVEKDHRFALMLRVKELPNLEIIEQDFLEFDLPAWIDASTLSSSIVGNIPYNISTPILMKIIPVIDKIGEAVLMVQKEFADRIAASCGGKNYGSLSVFCALRCKVEKLLQVSRNDFSPVPQVDSTVIRISKNTAQLPPEILQMTEKLTRHAFIQRRKKLSNSVKAFLNDSHVKDLSPVDFNKRPEELSPDQFVALAKWLFQ